MDVSYRKLSGENSRTAYEVVPAGLEHLPRARGVEDRVHVHVMPFQKHADAAAQILIVINDKHMNTAKLLGDVFLLATY